MTSEIRLNTLKNRVGLGTVNFTNTGPVVSGIVTANSFSATGDLDIDGHTNLDNLNVVGVSTFNGDINIDDGAADSAAGPELKLNRGSASPANADYLGQLKFAGRSSTGAERNYAKITGKKLDVTNGSEDGILEFAHIKAGSQTITGRWRSDSLQLLNGTALTVAGTSTFNGDITAAAGVDLNLDSTLGSNSSTAYSGFDGRLVFDTSYSDSPRGPNKIQLQNASNTWIGGFGVSANTLDIYTGGTTAFRRSSGTNTYTTQMSLDYLGNLSPSGDVRLTSSAGDNSSTAVTDAAWGRLEFDQDYSDTARGPNKILLTPFNNWKGGFGISSNSLDVYTGGNIHFYGKTNTDDAANKELLAKFATDGAVELYHNNIKTFETTNEGATFDTGSSSCVVRLTSNTDAVTVLQGFNSDFYLKGPSGGNLILYANGNEDAVKCIPNGAVELYHSGTKVVETHGSGLTFNQGSGNLIKYGTTSEFPNAAINIYRGGNGYANIRLSSNYGCGLYLAGANNNTDEFSINQDNQKNGYVDNRGGFISFNTGSSGTQRMKIENSAQITFMGNLFPSSDNSYDIGSGAKRWANIYTTDLHLSNEGKSNVVDGTWGDWTLQEGESDLFLINNRNGKKYQFMLKEIS